MNGWMRCDAADEWADAVDSHGEVGLVCVASVKLVAVFKGREDKERYVFVVL